MREKDKNESMMLLRYTRTQYASFYKFFFPLLAREEHFIAQTDKHALVPRWNLRSSRR
jgi:hypothetical protein